MFLKISGRELVVTLIIPMHKKEDRGECTDTGSASFEKCVPSASKKNATK